MLQLGDGALQGCHPCVGGILGRLRRLAGTAGGAAGAAVRLGESAEFLGDEVGEREALDEIPGVRGSGRGEDRPAARASGSP